MMTVRWLLVGSIALGTLPGCGGAFSTADPKAALDDDGATDAPVPEPDSGPGLLDQRTANPESGSRDAGSDAVATDAAEAGQPPEEAGTRDARVDAGPPPEGGGTVQDAQATDAQAEAGDAPNGCADDLSDIHAGDFHVDLDVLGVSGGGPLVEQRSTCGQYDVHWLVAETSSGAVITQFYDGSGGPQLTSIATINDGAWHHVAVARVALTFSITVDGQLDNSIADAVWSPPALPLLQVGRSACTSPFAGQVKNACVARQ